MTRQTRPIARRSLRWWALLVGITTIALTGGLLIRLQTQGAPESTPLSVMPADHCAGVSRTSALDYCSEFVRLSAISGAQARALAARQPRLATLAELNARAREEGLQAYRENVARLSSIAGPHANRRAPVRSQFVTLAEFYARARAEGMRAHREDVARLTAISGAYH